MWEIICCGTKLSNSGDTHKIERERDNRGSKLTCLAVIKEQRVDGSWQVSGVSCLRCILTGFGRDYKVKIPFKQINKVRFSTSAVKEELIINPWFITGFADGEGCFGVSVPKQKASSTG